MFWDEKNECLSRDEMTAIQEKSLKQTVKYACEKVPFYKQLLDEKGVRAEEIKNARRHLPASFYDKGGSQR